MHTFISYASEQSELAREIALALRGEGHDVFLDRSQLPEGDAYNARIRRAIRDCDLLVFLVSPEALSAGRYTLTELKFAEEKWPRPAGHLLPVMVKPTEKARIPAFLRSVTILNPMATWRRRSSPRSIASPDRGGRTPSAGMSRPSPCSPPLAQATAGGASTSTGERTAKPSGCSVSARSRRKRETTPPPGSAIARAAVAAPRNDTVAQAQERLAMDSRLDNIRVTEGKQTFTDIANTLQPVLARGVVARRPTRGERARASGLGRLSSLGVRARWDSIRHTTTDRRFNAIRRTSTRTPCGGTTSYSAAARSTRRRPTSQPRLRRASSGPPQGRRRIQIAALMRRRRPRSGERVGARRERDAHAGRGTTLGDAHDSPVWRLWNVYDDRLVKGTDKASFLAAVSPADHLATFRWLYPEEAIPKDKRALYAVHAGETSRSRPASEPPPSPRTGAARDPDGTRGPAGGRTFDDARQAVTRLGHE